MHTGAKSSFQCVQQAKLSGFSLRSLRSFVAKSGWLRFRRAGSSVVTISGSVAECVGENGWKGRSKDVCWRAYLQEARRVRYAVATGGDAN